MPHPDDQGGWHEEHIEQVQQTDAERRENPKRADGQDLADSGCQEGCCGGQARQKDGLGGTEGGVLNAFVEIIGLDAGLRAGLLECVDEDEDVVGADAEALKKLAEKNESVRELLEHEAEEAFLTRVEGGMDDFGRGAGAAGGDATNEDEDDASTIDAATASIKAFFPYLMVPQDAVEKVEGFLISSIKQLAADRVIG